MLFKKCKHDYCNVIGQDYFDSFDCSFYHYRKCSKCDKVKKFIGRIDPTKYVVCNTCGLHMVTESQSDFNPCDITTEYYCANCGTVATYVTKRVIING